MNIHGLKYEAKTEEDATAWIVNQAGKEMKRCVFPTRPCLNYYISKDGTMYGCKHCVRAKKYIAYECRPKVGRMAKGMLYSLYTTDGEVNKLAARLVWCTWMLGYWSEKIKVRYKDGNCHNIKLENLAELDNKWKIREEHSEKMKRFEKIYKQEFDIIVQGVCNRMGIPEEDAQDCVQEAYISVSQNYDRNIEYFAAKWTVCAQKKALDYMERQKTMLQIDILQGGWRCGKWDNYDDVSKILNQIKNKKDRRVLELVADGATYTEIMEEVGITRQYIATRLRRARGVCKAYLSTDKEIMKIYG